jgi:hypothetical protein
MSTKGGSVVLTTAAAAKIAVKTTTPGKRCEISHQCYFSIDYCFIIYLFASKTVFVHVLSVALWVELGLVD